MFFLKNRVIIAIDIGTSQIKAILYDPDKEKNLISIEKATSDCQILGLPEGFSELNPTQILNLVKSTIKEIVSLTPKQTKIIALTFTGAMHGIMFVAPNGKPLTNLIDWRDRRVEYKGNLKYSVLKDLLTRYDSFWTKNKTGCRPASGYGVSTLYWFASMNRLPQKDAYICTIADYVASCIAGSPLVTDCTLAASTGFFDIVNRKWCREILSEFGTPRIKLPEVVSEKSKIGYWKDIMVFPPSGDHAAAVYAVLKDRETDAHINIGTGSQVAVCSSKPYFDHQLETRIGLNDSFLLVVAGAVGGRTLDIWSLMIKNLLPNEKEKYSLDDLLLKAEAIEPGCNGLVMKPLFFGTRAEPSLRASLKGISPMNFTLGHLTRSCLEGMVSEWSRGLSVMRKYTKQRHKKIYMTGRLLKEKILLKQIVEEKIGKRVCFVKGSEVSALGAAQYAASSLSS